MAGVKGKSGRVADAAHHLKKQIAGRKGGNAKAGRVAKSNEGPTLEAITPADAEKILKLLPGKNPYDRVVLASGGAFSYLDGKTREQVNGEQLSNQRKQIEIDKESGALITQADVEVEAERQEAIWVAAMNSVMDLVPTLVSPEAIQGARMKAAAWIEGKLIDVANEIASQ